jgi:L,D-transpeptidase catalytic domain
MLAGWRGTVSAALAESTPNLDGDFGSLQPGQVIWDPERAPAGPVAIIVSIPKQLVFVYRNGILIGVSTCSTGKPGHSTPAGVFTILDKAKVHTSATYGDDAGHGEAHLEGHCAGCRRSAGLSRFHGCVHLPPDFADDLYAITQIGTPVILAGGHTDPASVTDPGPILGTTAREEIEAKIGGKPIPSLSPNAVMSILVSRGDMKIYELQNAEIVAEGAAVIKDP